MSLDRIGTLNESSLHAALKQWVMQPGDEVEVTVDGFVVDVVRGEQLIEIQTGSFGAMGHKLDSLLPSHPIRVVHPLAVGRWLEQPGKPRRKSPRSATVWSVFDELVSIPTLIDHPHFEVHAVLIHETERRSGTDLVARGRRGRVTDRVLDDIVGEHHFGGPEDLVALCPTDLPEVWTTADLARHAGISRATAQKAAYVLRALRCAMALERRQDGIRYRWV